MPDGPARCRALANRRGFHLRTPSMGSSQKAALCRLFSDLVVRDCQYWRVSALPVPKASYTIVESLSRLWSIAEVLLARVHVGSRCDSELFHPTVPQPSCRWASTNRAHNVRLGSHGRRCRERQRGCTVCCTRTTGI